MPNAEDQDAVTGKPVSDQVGHRGGHFPPAPADGPSAFGKGCQLVASLNQPDRHPTSGGRVEVPDIGSDAL